MVGSLFATFLVAAASALAPFADASPTRGGAELAPLRASLRIDTSSLREAGAGPAVARQLRSRAVAARERATIALFGGAADPVVAITVRPLRADIGYESVLVLERRGGFAVADARVDLRCDLCTEGELVLQLAGALEGVLAQLEDGPAGA